MLQIIYTNLYLLRLCKIIIQGAQKIHYWCSLQWIEIAILYLYTKHLFWTGALKRRVRYKAVSFQGRKNHIFTHANPNRDLINCKLCEIDAHCSSPLPTYSISVFIIVVHVTTCLCLELDLSPVPALPLQHYSCE